MFQTRSLFCIMLLLAILVSGCKRADNLKNDQKMQVPALIDDIYGSLDRFIIEQKSETKLSKPMESDATNIYFSNRLDQQEKDLLRKLRNETITVQNKFERLIVTLPQDILFDLDSSMPTAILKSDIRTIADSILAYPNTLVQVIGHTDNRGSAHSNEKLSTIRAKSFANMLVKSGVSPKLVIVIGQGERQPIASNLTPDGRSKNRRIEIIILPVTTL